MSSIIFPAVDGPILSAGSMYLMTPMTLELSVANTSYPVRPLLESAKRGVVLDSSAGVITVVSSGVFLVGIGGSFSSNKPAIIKGELLVNGSIKDELGFIRGVSASGRIYDVGEKTEILLDARDELGFCIKSDTANTDLEFQRAQFGIVGLG